MNDDYIQLLANVAGRDGNLLLNVGPDRNGKVDEPQAERLRQIGAWLDQYGESIYSTRGGPFRPADWGAATHRVNEIYLHVLKWPGDTLTLPAIASKVLKATALTSGQAKFLQTKDRIEISMPEKDHAKMDSVVRLELDSPAKNLILAGS